jgi:hypothetical protein
MDYSELRNKVLEALKISNSTSFSDEDLCQMLNKKRIQHHSDKIQDEELKVDFDKKFMEFDQLYKDFTREKVREAQSKEVALISNELDFFQTKQENIDLETENSNLKAENLKKDNIIKNLDDSIKIVSRESLLKEREALVLTLKPVRKSYIGTLGIIAGLTIGINILTKLESVGNILQDSFRVNANYVLLTLFSIICLIYIYNLVRESLIKQLSLSVCTVGFSRAFVKDKYSSFSDSNVYDFINSNLKGRKTFINWIYNRVFNLYNDTTIEVLKQIFILELLNKKVIRLGEVYGLERKYLIIMQYVEKNKNGEVFLKEY